MQSLDYNSRVKIKLTERGEQYFKDRFYPHIDDESKEWHEKHFAEDGYASFQLWDAMRIFGPLFEDILEEGAPFYNEILIEDKDLKTVNLPEEVK
jgi:hypothetical protein